MWADQYPDVLYAVGTAVSTGWTENGNEKLYKYADENKYEGFVSFTGTSEGRLKFLCQGTWGSMWGATTNNTTISSTDEPYSITYYETVSSGENFNDNQFVLASSDGFSGLYLVTIDMTNDSPNITFTQWSSSDVYEIGNAAQLKAFNNCVTQAFNTSLYGKLTADINMSGESWTPIYNNSKPTDDNRYTGTFDGDGHRIKNLTYSGGSIEGTALLFGWVGAATIKNLVIDSSCSLTMTDGTYNQCGALVGNYYTESGTLTIENCGNEANISGIGYSIGGLVGHRWGGDLVFTDCYNSGTISTNSSSSGDNVAGLLGNGSGATFTRCYNIGTISSSGATTHDITGDGSATFTNCYSYQSTDDNDGALVSSTQVTSGELAYFLNQYALYGGTWHQTVGSGHPVPFGSDNDVVFATLASCDGSSWTTSGFTNDKSTALIARASHTNTSDGKCALCGTWIISSPSTLTSFATAYNNGTADTYSTAYIDNNLNMSGESFPGIGSASKMFAGKLIGNGAKIISNLAIDIDGTDVGLVRVATDGAVVKNITTDCTCSFKGNSQVGAIIGTLNGGGNVYVENCGNEAPVEATNYNVGGLVGVALSSTKGYFTNCYNVGSVKSGIAGNAAGLTFNTDGAEFTRCYSYLNTESSGMFENKWFTNTGSYTATTCYGNNSSSNTDITDLSAATMANGTLQTNLGSSYYPSTIYGANAHPGFASQVSIKLDENDVNTLPNTDMTGMNVVLYRSLTKDMWNSICLPFDLGDLGSWFGTDTKAAEFTSATSSNLHFDLVASLSANTPYLLYPKEDKTSMSFNGVTVKAGGAGSVQPEGSDFKFAGIYSPTAIDGKYFIATGNTIKQSSGGNLKAFRAYIEDTTGSARELSLDFGENITGIDATLLNQDVMNHEFYNLAGQRVAKPGKGLYVVNGKKVVIK